MRTAGPVPGQLEHPGAEDRQHPVADRKRLGGGIQGVEELPHSGQRTPVPPGLRTVHHRRVADADPDQHPGPVLGDKFVEAGRAAGRILHP